MNSQNWLVVLWEEGNRPKYELEALDGELLDDDDDELLLKDGDVFE